MYELAMAADTSCCAYQTVDDYSLNIHIIIIARQLMKPLPLATPTHVGMAGLFGEAAHILQSVRSSEAEVETALSEVCLALFR